MSLDKTQHFIDIASNEAKKSNMIKKHGAILVHRNKVIGSGYNYLTPSSGKIHEKRTDTNKARYSIHAEVSCIRSVRPENRKYIASSVLIVVRINTDGDYLDSLPCKNCSSVINKYKIRKTMYTCLA